MLGTFYCLIKGWRTHKKLWNYDGGNLGMNNLAFYFIYVPKIAFKYKSFMLNFYILKCVLS